MVSARRGVMIRSILEAKHGSAQGAWKPRPGSHDAPELSVRSVGQDNGSQEWTFSGNADVPFPTVQDDPPPKKTTKCPFPTRSSSEHASISWALSVLRLRACESLLNNAVSAFRVLLFS